MAQKKVLDINGLDHLVDKLEQKYGVHGIIAKGTVATISALPTIANVEIGWLYNITTGGETTADFVEGAGKTIPDGANVICVDTGDGTTVVKKWDVQSGTFKVDDRLQFGTQFPVGATNGQPFLYLGVDTYTYDAVQDPTGNPQEQGWYEYDSSTETYVLTQDTEVQQGTSYFEKNEQYLHGVTYEYNTSTSSWVALAGGGDTIVPITDAEIDALFV